MTIFSKTYENYKGYKIFLNYNGEKNLTPGSGCILKIEVYNLLSFMKYETVINDENDIENLPHFIQKLYTIYQMVYDGLDKKEDITINIFENKIPSI